MQLGDMMNQVNLDELWSYGNFEYEKMGFIGFEE